jgi:hypothetical protein
VEDSASALKADDLGEPLLDGHPAGVLLDDGPGGHLVVVGDDDGGGVASQAGDDQLADGAGVGGQRHGRGFVYPGPGLLAEVAGPVQGDCQCWSWTRRSPPRPCSANSTPAASSSSPCGCAHLPLVKHIHSLTSKDFKGGQAEAQAVRTTLVMNRSSVRFR